MAIPWRLPLESVQLHSCPCEAFPLKNRKNVSDHAYRMIDNEFAIFFNHHPPRVLLWFQRVAARSAGSGYPHGRGGHLRRRVHRNQVERHAQPETQGLEGLAWIVSTTTALLEAVVARGAPSVWTDWGGGGPRCGLTHPAADI